MIQSMKMIKAKMMVRLTIFSLIVGILMSCSSPYEEVVTKDDDGNLVSSYTVRKEDGVKEGVYQLYIEGKLSEKGEYKNGKQERIRTLFDESGNKQVEETYVNGNITAKKTYFKNGTLESEGQYDEAVTMSGEWKYYYQNGKIEEIVNFKNNIEDGAFVEYYENGNKKAEGTYVPVSFGIEVEGKEDGELKEYNENGELVAKKQCEAGICKVVWTAEKGDIIEN